MAEVDGPFSDKEFDEFWLTGLFPEADQLFGVHQKPIGDIKADCAVALDANVLLLPYELGSSSFTKIAEVYRDLAQEKRLLIPAQAAREFVKNRAAKLRDLVKYINDQATSLNFSLHEQISFLGDEQAFKNIRKHSEDVEKARKKIIEEIKTIKRTLTANVGCDPVSSTYRDLFKSSVYDFDCTGEAGENLKSEALWRYRHKIPPGYKDRGKEDGGLGRSDNLEDASSCGSFSEERPHLRHEGHQGRLVGSVPRCVPAPDRIDRRVFSSDEGQDSAPYLPLATARNIRGSERNGQRCKARRGQCSPQNL